jgi:uncharacterized protein YjbI with pentapeptide repeats
VANPKHLAKLKEGVDVWNPWRREHPKAGLDFSGAMLTEAHLSKAHLSWADLSEANLSGADLRGADLIEANLSSADLKKANLSGADLSGADLSEANLRWAHLIKANLFKAHFRRADLSGADLSLADLSEANLSSADLSEANLFQAYLRRADFSGANLSKADLSWATLVGANLKGANLSGASLSRANLSGTNLSGADISGGDLTHATLVKTNLEGANLTACSVYGVSVWNVSLESAIQSNLVITPADESAIQVDNLEVAQFIYLLLNNEKIRDVIDTVGKKAVLILGRFTTDRKAVLDAIREALRENGYLPILFDFEKPSTRDAHETIVTLAGMVRFIIADITDPKSIPQELASIVPNIPSVPVQPLLQNGFEPWGMYDHIKRYHWVLPIVPYENREALLADLLLKVIAPAEAKAKEQSRK